MRPRTGPDDRRWWEEGPDAGRGPRPGPPGPPPRYAPGPPPPPGPPPTRTIRSGPPGWHVPPQGPPGRPPAGPPHRRPGPRRLRAPGVGGVIGALVVAGIALVVLFPEALGLDDQSPFAQIVAFRPQLAVLAVAVAALGALGAWTRRSGPDALLVAVALGLVGVVALADVGGRASGSAASVGTGGADGGAGGSLVVLSLNTYKGQADPDALADLVRSRQPDLVALPEARGDLRRRLASRLDDDQGGSGYRSYSADDADDASGMTVFVRSSLGRPTVSQDRSGTYPSVVVDLPRSAPGVASGLRFVAVHPRSPRPGGTGSWARDVSGLSRWCDAGRPTVVAGDMNSTEDHRGFAEATAGCTDAGSATGDGVTGTWPSWLPGFLGAQIDHVLTTDGPRATAFEVVPAAGTDHRAILARIGEG
ncbi:MAG TPA: endonuclease/exonuclease/phosphatase family protein [Actinomycetospora sp.]|uniref:endonuclease/exonuclease/phosphatase family protein n=1 Tax=Actinomycetospora sp. TaxID=1872135 RepID=UPI002F3FC315